MAQPHVVKQPPAAAYKLCIICCAATEAQQQAAEERAIAEATQHELQQQLADKDTALQQQRQHEQSWRFRQLEASTRALATLEHLQGRVDDLDAAATSYATAVQQQHDSQHSELEGQMSRLTAWEATAEELSGMGSRINTALVHMAQQWVAKQQKLRSSDKGMQVSSLCTVAAETMPFLPTPCHAAPENQLGIGIVSTCA